MKYKGTYRVLAEIEIETYDFIRDAQGNIAEDIELYIPCKGDARIYDYGHDTNGRMLLTAYVPSTKRGKNIKKAMEEQGVECRGYFETDEEATFHFKAKDLEIVAEIMKARTLGADISPFSTKNLPSSDYRIPEEDIAKYKEAVSVVDKKDLLIIHRITEAFLNNVLNRRLKKEDKNFNYFEDMRRNKMSRMAKEYIHMKNLWDDYLTYLKKEIKAYYKEKESKVIS